MWETPARLLRLLSLLQARRDWTGPELAERLAVTTRTVRHDIERLRGLGYPVHATPGVGGGYRLGAGAALPPLLLDDEEAVAVAVGLRLAAAGGVSGFEQTSLQALTKLEHLLPTRLRHRVTAMHSATLSIPRTGQAVSTGVLTSIAEAVRDHQRLRFDYRSHGGDDSLRTVEPHRLVHTRGRWYLVAWDLDRRGWRTFRADRIRPWTPHGPRFTPREPPGGDLAAYLDRQLGTATWRYRARVRVHAPAAHVTARVPPAVLVEPLDAGTCVITAGSDSPGQLAGYLGLLDADFTVDPETAPELAEQVRVLSRRYQRAVEPAPDP